MNYEYAMQEFYFAKIRGFASAEVWNELVVCVPFFVTLLIAVIWFNTSYSKRLNSRFPSNAVIPGFAIEIMALLVILVGSFIYTIFYVDFRDRTQACEVAKHLLLTKALELQFNPKSPVQNPDYYVLRYGDVRELRRHCPNAFAEAMTEIEKRGYERVL